MALAVRNAGDELVSDEISNPGPWPGDGSGKSVTPLVRMQRENASAVDGTLPPARVVVGVRDALTVAPLVAAVADLLPATPAVCVRGGHGGDRRGRNDTNACSVTGPGAFGGCVAVRCRPMASLERGFENALELRTGESIRWRGPAMYRIGRSWIGGRLYLTDQRLFFCPGVLVRKRYGVLRVQLAEITGAEVLGRRFAVAAISDGGLRPRLRVTTSSGDEHSFSMQRFRKRAGELQSLLQPTG